jgi:hypothetical protein
MAGLPKWTLLLFILSGLTVGLALTGWADDVQTSSNALQPVFDAIDSNVNADPGDQSALKTAIEDAADLGLLTPEQALAMLDLAQWSTLEDSEALANTAAILQTILADLVAGDITDPVTELTNLLNQLATPPGTLNAIGRAGASDEILDQVSSLVAGGVPPGIAVRVTKQGLRDGLTMDQISDRLDVLAAALAAGEDIAWGQVANAAANTEENTYQNTEMNTNTQGNDEPEQEANAAGNGKKDDNPGKGKGTDNSKDKGKGNSK